MRQAAIFRCRICPSASSGAAAVAERIAAASPSAIRSWIWTRRWASGALDGARRARWRCWRTGTLNDLMAVGAAAWSALRLALSRALRAGFSAASRTRARAWCRSRGVEMALPAQIGDYTDFYTSIHHATAVGRLLRPDNPLLPNYKWLPIGYHGRCSSIGVSGQQLAAAAWPATAAGRRRRRVVGPQRAARLRTGARRLHRPRATRCGTPIAHRGRRGACLRTVPAQRLVGARPAGLGIPAAGSVPRQELRDHDLAVDRDAARRWRRSALPWARAAEDPQPLPYLAMRRCCSVGRHRHPARVAHRNRAHAARRAARRTASRSSNFRTPTGPSRRCWRITPSTAATCGRAICSAPARSPDRHRKRPARCWNCPAVASTPIALADGE